MNKLFVLLLIILLALVVVFVAAQDFKNPLHRSRTARMQQLDSDAINQDSMNSISEEKILTLFLTEEQRATLKQQPRDLATIFSHILNKQKIETGESDA
jgi:hypothetical protein